MTKPTPPPMELEVMVNLRWVNEVRKRSQLYGLMWSLAKEMLEDIPPDLKQKWLDRLRGVDTMRRTLYDVSPVSTTAQRNTPALSGVPKQESPVKKPDNGGARMRSEEE